MELLSPEEARQVLVGAQKSVEVDYSGIEETERVIEQNGYKVNIHITKPKTANLEHRYLSLSMVVDGCLEIILHTAGW